MSGAWSAWSVKKTKLQTHNPTQQRSSMPNTSHLRSFRPGQSGNPGGRPKGLARMVRDKIDSGDRHLVDMFYDIAYGLEPGFGKAERMEALKWLGDRGYGKAPDLVLRAELTSGQTEEMLDLLTAEDLRMLARVDAPPSLPVATTLTLEAETPPDSPVTSTPSGPASETD